VPDEGPARIMSELVPTAREQFFAETGITIPAVRLRPHCAGLATGGYVLRLNEVPMARGEVVPGSGLVVSTPEQLREFGIAGRPATHPDGRPACWIAADALAAARQRGLATLEPDEVIIAHLLQLLRRYGHEFIGIQEAQTLLDGLERTHPALVREVVPKLVAPALLADVLRRLAEEGISLRGLRDILGALAEWAPLERDPVALTEHVRSALRRQITFKYASQSGVLGVYLLDPVIEETVREAIQRTATGSYLALEPALSRDITKAVGAAVAGQSAPVVLTTADIRRYVRRLVEAEHPQVAVVSYQELSPDAKLQPLGRIRVGS
jgi:type III secretion protein V